MHLLPYFVKIKVGVTFYVRLTHETLLHRTFVSWLFLILIATSCGQASVQVPRPKPVQVAPTPGNTLRSFAQARGFYIGTTANVGALQKEQQYRNILAAEFNMMTPEVSMKFDATEPEQGHYTFTNGDTLVAFAKVHSMQVRGHNLVWYLALPSWLKTGHFTREELMTILHAHILAEVSHYRGEINIWDVVNEAINNDGSLRASIWSRVIGPNFLDLAFRWAHEANPQARLFYNDYGAEGLGQKSDAVYHMVAGMMKRGVPINGVGLQMHVSVVEYPPPQDVLANIRRLTAMGLEVQITEMDVKIQNDHRPVQERLAAEAQIYRDMLSTCLAVARCTAFVMWGFTDRHSWIPGATGHPDAPLIYDAGYQPKPAYFALLNVLKQ